MKPLTFLLTLSACLMLQVVEKSESLHATNYAMSLPGGDGTINSGALSNIDISGVPLSTLPYTIEMWIKINQSQVQYAGLVYHRVDASINSGVQFAANWQMGATPNAIRIINTSGYGLISDTITLNNWHHIAVVITESSRTCYVDGHKTTENITIPPYDFSIGSMWIGRDSANATNDNRAFKGLIDEVRIWNVARTVNELTDNKYLTLTGSEAGLVGYWNFNDSASLATDLSPGANHGIITGGTYVRATPTELMTALGNLTLGDLSAVENNLTLPTTAAGGVTIRWASTNTSIIDTLGVIQRPELYDATVRLTATLYQTVDGVTYTFTKVFTAVVKSKFEAAMQVAKWDFTTENILLQNGVIKVKDASESAFSATLMNEASIRTIGTSDQYNVLDLGNGTGYLDMDTEIGKAIYSLNNYTVCGYFRIDEDYANLTNAGNFYWTFSNTANAASDKTGYIIGSLSSLSHSVSSANNTVGNQTVSADTNAAMGSWHHIAYTQNGEVGTIYIDGEQVATGPMSNIPSLTLPQIGRTGTLYNWLGRSPYTGDVYLRKTLLYDFQIWRDAMSSDDLKFDMGVSETLGKLNNAYNENSHYILPELNTEMEALTLGNLSAVTSNLTLPSKGSIDQTISILWKTNRANIISASGVVTRPDYFPMNVTLTATLFKNGQSVTRNFTATVLEKAGTAFTSNLLVKYDFSDVSDTVVTDVAEKHFKGALVNGADIRSIGEITKYNTLDLTDSTGYFDLGTEVGKLIYHLSDYTMSCYYRVDNSYAISNAGNFLWTFSNSNKTATDQNGCLFGGLRSQTMAITPTYWSGGEQVVSASTAPLLGSWHNMTYTQKDTIGTLYVDGMPVNLDTITWVPSNTLVRNNSTGTLYNWLGRSCYVGDAYLTKTLIYDFRIYDKALTEEEIQITELNVGANINALEAAYAENPNIPSTVKSARESSIRIYTTKNGIRINGLTGNEKVTLYDIAGRQIRIIIPSEINISHGLYLVKVDNNVTKVFVR